MLPRPNFIVWQTLSSSMNLVKSSRISSLLRRPASLVTDFPGVCSLTHSSEKKRRWIFFTRLAICIIVIDNTRMEEVFQKYDWSRGFDAIRFFNRFIFHSLFNIRSYGERKKILDRKLFAKIRVKLVNNGGEFLSDFLLVLNY